MENSDNDVKYINLAVSKKFADELTRYCRKQGVTKTALVARAVEEFMARNESIFVTKEA